MHQHATGRRSTPKKRGWLAPLLSLAAVFGLVATVHAIVVNGNIHPLAIEIDGNDSLAPPNNNTANLYPDPLGPNPATDDNGVACPAGFVNGPTKNSGATADWVKDCKTNSDPISVIDSVATGIDLTGAGNPAGIKTGAAKLGHWNGARVVDGFGGADQDIFIKGGKINDLSTWTIGPGNLGSAKYDITQAYLASNKSTLFVAMERSGNNGTTAFDFEFNQLPPVVNAYIPNRSMGDVLLTFEMQGSGSSGSAVPHYFLWNGSTYVEKPVPAGVITSINNSPIAAAPWGTVDGTGTWVTTNIPRFQFAEAAIPRSIFGNVNPCGGGHAFVGLHTRSSASGTSDMKDVTRIFEYKFGGPDAEAAYSTSCSAGFSYDGSQSRDSFNELNLTWNWSFLPPAGVTLSGQGLVGPDANGVYHSASPTGAVNVTFSGTTSAQITATLTVTEIGTTCTDSKAQTFTVLPGLAVNAALTQQCGHHFGYSALASGGDGTVVYAWTFQKSSGGGWTTVGTSALPAGTFDAPSAGIYQALLAVTSGGCTATPTVAGSPFAVYDDVAASAALTANCGGTFDYAGSPSGGKAPYTCHWNFTVNPTTAALSGSGVSGGSGAYSSSSQNGTGVQVIFNGAASATITATLTTKDANNCTVVCNPQSITVYPSLNVGATLTARCGNAIDYSSLVLGGTGTYTYAWQFQQNSKDDGTGTWSSVGAPQTTGSGTLSAPSVGRYRALLTVTSGSCSTSPAITSNEINVYDPVGGSASLIPDCGLVLHYSAAGMGGKAPYTFDWTVQKLVSGSWVTAAAFSSAGAVSAGDLDASSFNASAKGAGHYRAQVKITDSQGLTPPCSSTMTTSEVDLFDTVTASATLTPQCGNTLGYASVVNGGSGTNTYAWQFQKNSKDDGSGTWSNIDTRSDDHGTFSAPSAGRYRALLTVTSGGCSAMVTSNEANVYDAVGGGVLLTPDCDNTFACSATATGGKPGYTFAWTIQKLVLANWVTAHTFTDTPAAATSSGGLDVDSFSPGGDGHYRVLVTISDSQGPNLSCSITLTSNEIDVRHQLTVTAAKMGADPVALSATLHGTVSDTNGVTLQWQRLNGSTWVSATGTGATTDTLTYSSFEADGVPLSTSFSLGGDSYVGQLWTVQLRLHAQRTLNGTLCEANSDPVTVKLVKGVDP